MAPTIRVPSVPFMAWPGTDDVTSRSPAGLKSYISEADGKIYCEYEAPNAEALWEHARRAGLPIDRVSEIGLEISPDMFV